MMRNLIKRATVFVAIVFLFSCFGMNAYASQLIKTLYIGNDLTAQVNGYEVLPSGGNANAGTTNKAYDATAMGGDSKAIYSKLKVGKYYRDSIATSYVGVKWGGVASYVYNEVAIPANQHMSIVDVSSIINSGYAAFEIKLEPFSSNVRDRVDINSYYIVLGRDFSYANGLFAAGNHYACIQLKDYYSVNDIGTWKYITVPLSQFDITTNANVKYLVGSKESWGVSCPATYPFTRICSLGVIAYATDEVRDWEEYNNLYLDNMAIYNGEPTVSSTFQTAFAAGQDPIETMQSGDITVTSNICRYAGQWIAARYNAEGKLMGLASEKVPSNYVNQQKSFTFEGCEATDEIKVLFWNDFEKIMPLKNAVTLSDDVTE